MSEVKINSELLNAEIEKLKRVSASLEELISRIKTENNNLRDFWSTRTSDGVFADFDIFNNILENVKNTNNQDIKFLENVVNSNYINYEEKTNILVDDNISV